MFRKLLLDENGDQYRKSASVYELISVYPETVS
jgi:hypothetical protein